MKKFLGGLATIAGIALSSLFMQGNRPTVIHGQSLPLVKTIAWDASVVDATHGAPDSYTVRLDGTVVGTASLLLTRDVTFTSNGPHTITVTATNTWGSAVATLNVVVAAPNAPGNPRVQ